MTSARVGSKVRAKRRGARRERRDRAPWPGQMIHQDGSTQEWVPGQRWDLIDHLWRTPEAEGKVDRKNLTQFGQALARLGFAEYTAEGRLVAPDHKAAA